jgi:pimeloyl-[acyl-carrier protein] methyl ester esterase
MSDLCLTGWQQPHDALAELVPDALHFNYAGYDNMRNMFAALPREPRLAVGWSLGGQLLARAISDGYVKPKRLILLGAPFQWVADADCPQGFPAAAVEGVRGNYIDKPEMMLKNLNGLVALGDVHERRIIKQLNRTLQVWPNGMYWLDKLTNASCRKFDFSVFPPTIIIHGMQDKVIHPWNAKAFAEAMPKAELLLWPECAHAPQLHDLPALQEIVKRHV